MDASELDRAAEEERLARTLSEVHRQIDQLRGDLHQRRGDVVATRAEMWEDMPRVIRDFDDAVEFTQHQQILDRQERDFVLYRDMLPRLERMADSPYFGRIDFLEDGGEGETAPARQSEALYIGIAALIDSVNGEPIVYDWRAPVSGMFYDFEPGPAHYVAAGGEIRGELTRKRQYKIERGRLLYLFDTDVKIDDDLLQDILGQNVDRRMRAIVQSIQREQNQIIRDEAHRLLVVQGPAGSGKTSIALHRVAYFLYRYRDAMRSENIAVLSPNEIFNDYIGNVLPELGEENMRRMTVYEVAGRILSRPVERLEDQMEYLLSSPRDTAFATRVAGISFKGSPKFLALLTHFVAGLQQGEDAALKSVEFRGKTVITKEEMVRLLRETYDYLPYGKRLEKLKRRILYLLEPLEEERLKEIQAELENHPDHNRATRSEIRRMSKAQLREETLHLREELGELAAVDTLTLYLRLFSRSGLPILKSAGISLPANFNAIAADTRSRLGRGEIGYEDVGPLLYLNLAIGESQPMEDIKHVVVDETQDYSAVHFAALERLFSKATFTLLGDVNQAIHPYLHAPAFDEIEEAFNITGSHVMRLTRSYRNTQEIAAFAKGILEASDGPREPIEPIERTGPKPQLVHVPDEERLLEAVGDGVNALKHEGFDTVAVICRTAAEASRVYEGLRSKHSVTLLTQTDRSFTRGVVVIPSYLAKGLEFDAVILYDVSATTYAHEDEVKVLYTACTRALHRLILYYSGELCDLLADVDPSLAEAIEYAVAPKRR